MRDLPEDRGAVAMHRLGDRLGDSLGPGLTNALPGIAEINASGIPAVTTATAGRPVARA